MRWNQHFLVHFGINFNVIQVCKEEHEYIHSTYTHTDIYIYIQRRLHTYIVHYINSKWSNEATMICSIGIGITCLPTPILAISTRVISVKFDYLSTEHLARQTTIVDSVIIVGSRPTLFVPLTSLCRPFIMWPYWHHEVTSRVSSYL